MMLCRSRPYEGTEAFLFFSYCQKNASEVYPMIEQMARDGYRIWYDDGINPGEDWMDVIADHLHRSAAVVAAITPESAESHNCRNEINFAMEFQKPVVSVMLRDFPLPLAIRLQLGVTQYVPRYQYANQREFYEKLYDAACLKPCRGERQLPDRNDVRAFEEAQMEAQQQRQDQRCQAQQKEVRKALQMTCDMPTAPPAAEMAPNVQVAPETAAPIPAQKEVPEQPPTVPVQEPVPARPYMTNLPLAALLVHMQTGTLFSLPIGATRIGRSEADCRIAFPDNPKMSRHHADLQYNGECCYLVDANSLNHSFVNNIPLAPGTRSVLRCFDTISIAQETLIFLSGPAAQELQREGTVAWLQQSGGNDRLWVPAAGITLGRSPDPANSGLLQDRKISRSHAALRFFSGDYVVRDLGSSNGTFVNGYRLMQNQEYRLYNGDRLRLGLLEFQFIAISLCGKGRA